MMVGWRTRWMWIEIVYVFAIDARAGVVGFLKGVGRIAYTYRMDIFQTYHLGDFIWWT